MPNKKCNQSHSTTVTSKGMSKFLGQGAFGKVFKERIGGVTCAVKRIKNYEIYDDSLGIINTIL